LGQHEPREEPGAKEPLMSAPLCVRWSAIGLPALSQPASATCSQVAFGEGEPRRKETRQAPGRERHLPSIPSACGFADGLPDRRTGNYSRSNRRSGDPLPQAGAMSTDGHRKLRAHKHGFSHKLTPAQRRYHCPFRLRYVEETDRARATARPNVKAADTP